MFQWSAAALNEVSRLGEEHFALLGAAAVVDELTRISPDAFSSGQPVSDQSRILSVFLNDFYSLSSFDTFSFRRYNKYRYTLRQGMASHPTLGSAVPRLLSLVPMRPPRRRSARVGGSLDTKNAFVFGVNPTLS